MMQMKQQQELQRYLQQVQQNIETVSASELLQALMAQQTYAGPQPMPSASTGLSTTTVWSSIAPAGVTCSIAGARQSPTYVRQSVDVSGSETVMSVADTLHTESVAGAKLTSASATTLSPSTIDDGLTSADIWSEPAVPATTVNTDTAAIPHSLDLVTTTDVAQTADMVETTSVAQTVDTAQNASVAEAASVAETADLAQTVNVTTTANVAQTADVLETSSVALSADMAHTVDVVETTSMAQTVDMDDRYSPGTSQRDDVRPATSSSDGEVSNNEESVHLTAHRKQSAEAGALLTDVVPLASDTVDKLAGQLPEVSSLGFVPIQNQQISSRSDSMDSMASSVAGCSQQQCVEYPDVVHQPTSVSRETTAAESKCNTSTELAAVVSGQRPDELLDTMQSLLGQLAAGGCDAVMPSHSLSSATSEPAQQLQQSQAMIHQQQQQQLTTIASAIENLQHLRSLQEVIGNLAVALKTSQLEMLSAALQAREVSTLPPPASNVAGVMPAAVRPPTVVVSSYPSVPMSVAVPPAAAVPTPMPELGSLPPQSALGLLQYPTTGSAALLMQQQQQVLLSAMMQSAPYQQQQQQLLMQQLLSQNAAVMPDTAAPSRVAQQSWPMMMMPPHCAGSTVQRAVTPGLPVVTPAMTPGLPAVTPGMPVVTPVVTPGLPAVTPGLPVVTPAMTPGLPVMVSAPRAGVQPVLTPGSLAMPPPAVPAAAQTPVVAVRPTGTSSSSSAAVTTSLPDQR